MIVNFQSLDPSQLEELAWKELQTVVVLGPVSRAVWWPPNGELPGVLAARDFDQVVELLERLPGAHEDRLEVIEGRAESP